MIDLFLNEECMRIELDLLQELHDKAKVREEACKKRAARRYNSKTKLRSFLPGDLVLRAKGEARKDNTQGKLTANWKGSF